MVTDNGAQELTSGLIERSFPAYPDIAVIVLQVTGVRVRAQVYPAAQNGITQIPVMDLV